MSHHTEVIAEIANAHQGDPAQAVTLAMRAAEAGADAVKFQIYYAHELLVRQHPRFAHFEKQSFAPAVWRDLLAEVKARGINVYCDVFGLDALETARAANIAGYKIHASDLQNDPLLAALAETPGRVIIAAGGATTREIAYAVSALARGDRRPVLLHGFQAYPTALEDSSLARIAALAEVFGDTCDIGYADHISGDDPQSLTIPIFAIGMGARVIEKHVTLDRAAKGVDYFSSLNPDEFAGFIRQVRACDVAVGQRWAMPTAEMEYRRSVKKHWVAARALDNGHRLTQDDLVMKRVHGATVDPLPLDKLLGRRLKQGLDADAVVARASVETIVWALPVARNKSSRLSGKALIDIAGRPALEHLFERLKQCGVIDRIVFCTTSDTSDDVLVALAEKAGIAAHRGADDDVLDRMIGALGDAPVDIVLRVTGDDILVDPDYVAQGVAHHLASHAEYTDLKALPSGTEVEVFDADLLKEIRNRAVDSSGTEYLTNFVTDNADQFRVTSFDVSERHRRDWRLTLDTPEDLALITRLLEHMHAIGKPVSYRLDDIVSFFESHPDALKINAAVRQRSAPIQVTTALRWPSQGAAS